MAVTTRRIHREVLEPTMDARALNLAQADVLAHLTTPEPDSAIEWCRALRATLDADPLIDRSHPAYGPLEALEDTIWQAVEYNGREGQREREVAGNAERMAAELWPVRGRVSLRAAEVARRLRPILDRLDGERDPIRWMLAARDLVVLQRHVPVETLRSRSLAHELGRSKTRLLRGLLDATGGEGAADAC